MTLLELKDISFSFEENSEEKLLENINLIANKGDFILITGPSGSGKTSLLNIISGVIPHYHPGRLRGKVFLKGEEISKEKIYQRARNLGTVFQNADDQLIFESAEDEIAFPLENLNKEPGLIKKTIDKLMDWGSFNPNLPSWSYSGGEKAKLIMAATLAMDQDLLILDEPLANLDMKTSLKLLESLKSLCQQGKAVILVEHRLDLVLPFVSKVFRVEGGLKELDIKDLAREKEKERKIKARKIDSPPLVELENISLEKKSQTIVKDINLKIKEGEKILLTGDNGSGKTSLINIISRLEKPSSGTYKTKIGKENFYDYLGLVLQNPDYQLFMPTIEEEVMVKGKDRDFAYDLMGLFGFSQIKDNHPLSLSEGQKRALGFISILAKKPKFLILDEPSVGLDESLVGKLFLAIRTLEKNLGNQSLSLLVVTHDQRIIGENFTSHYKMDEGELFNLD